MKNSIKLLGLAMLAALLMFAVIACDEEGEDDDLNPELPSELQNTAWKHTSGDKIKFGINTVTFGTSEYKLRKSESINEGGISQTIFYFGEGDSNTITYRNGDITLVRLGGVTKGATWTWYDYVLEEIESLVAGLSGGSSIGNPAILSLTYQLDVWNWERISNAISTVGKYVALDLSRCTRSSFDGVLRSDGVFNPFSSASAGYNRIVSLILPNTATSIMASSSTDNPTFRYFGNLTSISGSAVISIGEEAFRGCTSLTSVSFPKVASIGYSTFNGCTSLSSVSIPSVNSISTNNVFSNTGTTSLTITLGATAPSLSRGLFSGVNSAKTVTVKVPNGATGYGTITETYSGSDTTENWGNGFRGGGWNGTAFQPEGTINSNITLHVQYQ